MEKMSAGTISFVYKLFLPRVIQIVFLRHFSCQQTQYMKERKSYTLLLPFSQVAKTMGLP